MAGVEDHEKVSIYPLTEDQLEDLLNKVGECTFNWATKDGWPVGVIMSFLWKDGRFWVTAGAHRHRIAAIRRDPRVSIVVSGAAQRPGSGAPVGAATAKGRCVIHEDHEIKDWFYPNFSRKLRSERGEEAVQQFVEFLDSPARVVVEFIPTKKIVYDGEKMAAATPPLQGVSDS